MTVTRGACITLLLLLCVETQATTYVDPQNQVALTVTPSPPAVSGHVAWWFNVTPVDSATEVSSIDAATGTYGFSGEAFCQVSPGGQATVFTEFKVFFSPGEDETTDASSLFTRSSFGHSCSSYNAISHIIR